MTNLILDKVLSTLKTIAIWHITDKDKKEIGTLITGVYVNNSGNKVWFRPVIRHEGKDPSVSYANFVIELNKDQYEDWTSKSEFSFLPEEHIENLQNYVTCRHSPAKYPIGLS